MHDCPLIHGRDGLWRRWAITQCTAWSFGVYRILKIKLKLAIKNCPDLCNYVVVITSDLAEIVNRFHKAGEDVDDP